MSLEPNKPQAQTQVQRLAFADESNWARDMLLPDPNHIPYTPYRRGSDVNGPTSQPLNRQPSAPSASQNDAAYTAQPLPTLGGKESTGGFRTTYIGIEDASHPGQYLGQVEVQFNPKTNRYTAYGLGGLPVELPHGVTREQIASGQFTGGVDLIPMKGPGTDGGASHVTAISNAIADRKAGKLDEETINRVNHYLAELTISANHDGNWSDDIIVQLAELTLEFDQLQDKP